MWNRRKQLRMKRIILLYITLLAATIGLVSCDKKDINGDLDGQWQLVRWENKADGNVVKDGPTYIYWTVKLQLIQIYDKTPSAAANSINSFCEFQVKGDSLVLTQAYKRPDDSKIPFSDLQQYGVPSNGRLKIESMDSRNLVLSSTENKLYFRKNE